VTLIENEVVSAELRVITYPGLVSLLNDGDKVPPLTVRLASPVGFSSSLAVTVTSIVSFTGMVTC